ncbi:MAG: MoxR family ATPase, partial [Thalassolituus sp.]
LEAMEERQVTVEGKSLKLPQPFFVIATQNPMSQAGTFPLPESQLDRFLLSISLGYPDEAAERALLEGTTSRADVGALQQVVSEEQLLALRHQVDAVRASPAVLDYVQRLLAYSRYEGGFSHGLSPRAGIALVRVAKAWSLLHERDYLIPEDVQAVLSSVADHRLVVGAGQKMLNHVRVLA